MAEMELFQAKDHYILQSGEKALWCSRKDGTMEVRPATDLLLAWNPVCLGLVEGVIGKIQLHADLPLGLIMIRQKVLVGRLPEDHNVYKITKITVIPLSEDEPQDLELEPAACNYGTSYYSGTNGGRDGEPPPSKRHLPECQP